MVAFAAQTGAGGFGFDYTYFEQNPDGTAGPNPSTPASQYSQWTGWRKILSRLHKAKGGLACGGGQYGAGVSSCVVDNRQQNHACARPPLRSSSLSCACVQSTYPFLEYAC